MLNWSVSFITKMLYNDDLLYAGLSIASLNMLVQIALDFISCGSKRWSKIGGWFD